MADLTQSSQTTATTAPSFYTDYLSNLASKGTAAGAAVNPAAWDATPLQQQAFTGVSQNVGNYQPGLTAATNTLGTAAGTDVTGAANPYLTAGTTTSGLSAAQPNLTAGSSSSADLVGDYMNPYTKNVIDQIRLANQQNIAQNLSPAITSGAVGAGQFGSQRGANALALGISNADIGALTAQTGALQSGYTQALQAAQAQRAAQLTAGQYAGQLQNQANANQVAAGQIAGNAASQQGQLGVQAGTQQGNLAETQQKLGLNDVNALATLGGQQQTIQQNKQLMPLDVLGKQAGVMTGAQLPMTTTSTMTGSPLSAIAGLGTLGIGLTTKNASGTTPLDNIISSIKSGASTVGGLFGGGGGTVDPTSGVTQNGQYLSYGSPVQGTGPNGGAGAGQVAGSDGKVYTDPTYGTGYQTPPGYQYAPTDAVDYTPPPSAADIYFGSEG